MHFYKTPIKSPAVLRANWEVRLVTKSCHAVYVLTNYLVIRLNEENGDTASSTTGFKPVAQQPEEDHQFVPTTTSAPTFYKRGQELRGQLEQ